MRGIPPDAPYTPLPRQSGQIHRQEKTAHERIDHAVDREANNLDCETDGALRNDIDPTQRSALEREIKSGCKRESRALSAFEKAWQPCWRIDRKTGKNPLDPCHFRF
ncbi:hypothetical protein [Paraburkholderia unamae]|uniref:hypothetical protein n=1 Tax=Paraburkholderia unamae TaxID=219649 RepID=UPI001057742E|nr:hypothetical protein [Paraburkholderia unamae]CAG9271013.1 hypothetical protein PUN4_630050 [Paraburkholderia unamae]